MTRFGHFVDGLMQSLRRRRLASLYGLRVPPDCKLGRDITASGDIRIDSGVSIGDGAYLSGNIELGANCRIGRHAELHGNITLGKDCVVGSFSILNTAPGASMRVGEDTYINSYNVLGSSANLEIGAHCIFAAYVYITDATHGIDDLAITTKHAPSTASPVRVGDNVWLGCGVMVMMGASIGNDAVVGAQSLVRGHLPDRSISIGTPAKVHRIRE
jgi:acetyltransferase-like isoleucine patch superfamily enzyme